VKGLDILAWLSDYEPCVSWTYFACRCSINTFDKVWKGLAVKAGEFITSPGVLAQKSPQEIYTARQIRRALEILHGGGLLAVEPVKDKFTRVRLPSQVTVQVTAISSKNQRDLQKHVTVQVNDVGVVPRSTDSLTSVSLGGCRGGAESHDDSSHPQTPSPSEKDTAIRDQLIKSLDLYAVDPKLNRVDKRGRIAVVELYRTFRAMYPAVDVVAQFKEAHTWEVTHPNRQKKNRAAFFHRWMKKEQADGGVFKHGPITKDEKPRRDVIVPPPDTASAYAEKAYTDPKNWVPPTEEDLRVFSDFRKGSRQKQEAVK
jgi:hypothetical protein